MIKRIRWFYFCSQNSYYYNIIYYDFYDINNYIIKKVTNFVPYIGILIFNTVQAEQINLWAKIPSDKN